MTNPTTQVDAPMSPKVYPAMNAVMLDLSKAGIGAWPGYHVTANGDVFSGGRKLIPQRSSNGYLHVTLCKSGEKRQFSIHRLVAAAFIRSFQKGEVTNHINGDKADNRLQNLEIVTVSRNTQHAYDRGLRTIDHNHRNRAAQLGRSKRKLSDESVRTIRVGYDGKRGSLTRLAQEHKTDTKTIRKILSGTAFGDVV